MSPILISKRNSISRMLLPLLISMLFFMLTVCDKQKEKQGQSPVPSIVMQQPASPEKTQTRQNVVVISVSNAGPYSYIEVEENGTRTWLATSQLQIKQGDLIQYKNGQVMTSFHSKALDRTFDEIVFTDSVTVVSSSSTPSPAGEQAAVSRTAEGMPPKAANDNAATPTPAPAPEEKISVQKIEGGYSVAELYANKTELNGKTVKVRGQVVKYLTGIMGKNWIHLRDGSGSEGDNDITITTNETAQKGDIIVSTGKLTVDKDFGQGYRYPVIMEDVTIVVEK
ncbi:DNA-binding protein [Deltaproteobacteria bacterium TL4]